MKRIILLTVCCIVVWNLHAQRTTDEQPYGLSSDFKAIFQEPIVLPLWDMEIIMKEDMLMDQKGGPVPYAYPIRVNFTPENSGIWQEMDDGSKVWRLKVHIPGALGSNTYYQKIWLPEGGKFFVYSEDTKQSIGAIISEFIEGSKDEPIQFATALIYGENVVYEYYQPASVKESPVISISCIDYAYRYVNNPYNIGLRSFGDALSCNININCPAGNNWQAEKHAVVRISIPFDNRTAWGSGALVNNTNNDYTPYVLTADHNFVHPLTLIRYYDAEGSSVANPYASFNASGMIFYWEYEHPGCSNSPTEPTPPTSSGATVIANNPISDFGLLKIKPLEDPRLKPGVVPYYLGWDNSGNAVSSGVGIHHPRGDVKKISLSNQIQNYSNQIGWDMGITPANSHWIISYTIGNGITEKGSSGSPFINNNRKVIGQLHGGSVSCIDTCNCPSIDKYYGKFNVSWTGNGSSNIQRRLNHWLDSAGFNPPTLNGTFAITGPSSIHCMMSNSIVYSVTNLPAGFTWGCSSHISIISTSGNQVTVAGNAAGAGYVCVKNANGVEVGRINVDVYKSYITGLLSVTSGQPYLYTVIPACFTPTNYAWTVNSQTSPLIVPVGGGSSANITFPPGQSAYTINVFTSTGQPFEFDNCSVTVYVTRGGNSPFAVYPNPVNSVLYVDIDQQAIRANSPAGSKIAACEIRLYNILGVLVLQTTSNSNKEQLNVSHLPDGMYFIHLYDGVNSTPEVITIVIKH